MTDLGQHKPIEPNLTIDKDNNIIQDKDGTTPLAMNVDNPRMLYNLLSKSQISPIRHVRTEFGITTTYHRTPKT
tara:strand:- start:45 stop:266 length:222 start_codon:yes stop_codon:yes gene_type:complete